jgi:hypothetical protein
MARGVAIWLVVVLLSGVAGAAWGEGAFTNLLPNSSFESGDALPYGWDGFGAGERRWEFRGADGERCVSVSGSGRGAAWWYADCALPVQYNRLYRVSYWVRQEGTGGSRPIIAGLNLAQHYGSAGPEWERQEYVFRSPNNLPGPQFRLGQENADGKVFFDSVEMRPAVALHRSQGSGRFRLGQGETVSERRYTAVHDLAKATSNDRRFLFRYSAAFDHDRWVLERLDEVVYVHEVSRYGVGDVQPGARAELLTRLFYRTGVTEEPPSLNRSLLQEAATIEVDIARCDGTLLLQVSPGTSGPWIPIAETRRAGTLKVRVPGHMQPRRELAVRLQSFFARRIEITGYRYTSLLDQGEWRAPIAGESRYLALLAQSPDLGFDLRDIGELTPGGRSEVRLLLENHGPRRKVVASALVQRGNELVSRPEELVFLGARSQGLVCLPYTVAPRGEQRLTIVCRDADSGTVLLALETNFTVGPPGAPDAERAAPVSSPGN